MLDGPFLYLSRCAVLNHERSLIMSYPRNTPLSSMFICLIGSYKPIATFASLVHLLLSSKSRSWGVFTAFCFVLLSVSDISALNCWMNTGINLHLFLNLTAIRDILSILDFTVSCPESGSTRLAVSTIMYTYRLGLLSS